MKLNVGYQLTGSDAFLTELLRQKERIGEVYFSYGTMPNGRHAADASATLPAREVQRRTEEELSTLSRAGFCFNLLLNANCYGEDSLSRAFFTEVCEAVDEVGERFGLASVTTTSPVLAHLIKMNFPALEVRASVNMEIGTPEAIAYLAADFDGFYLARELNRDLPALRRLSDFCLQNGRKRYLLANSGCLMHCPARQFHDNLVAHESGIARRDNAVHFSGICRDFFRRAGDGGEYLSRLSFIRPEDLSLYEGLCDGMKLATRVNAAPAAVLHAYANGHFAGNLLSLLEPDHAAVLYPRVIENRDLPPDFGARVSACGGRDCSQCGYCRDAFAGAIRTLHTDITAESGCSCGKEGNQC